MRPIFIVTLAMLAITAFGSDTAVRDLPAARVPDLTPQLTQEEVAKTFAPWSKRVAEIAAKANPEQMMMMGKAIGALGYRLPKVTGITLYSLYPLDGLNIVRNAPKGAGYEKLPRFHDYPILGQLKIEDPAQANRWVDFLRDQIVPGPFLMCDFMPRHGFRLTTANGNNIDLLMCYSCGDLAFFGGAKLDKKVNPIFSTVTRDMINQLFDKLHIKRDEPLKKQD